MGLISSQILSLDSNIFISANDPQNEFHQLAKDLLLQTRNLRVVVSVLVFEEFLVKFYQKGSDRDLALYENFLTGGGSFTVKDFDRQTARKAAQIRAKYPSIKTPDAIHIATAIESVAQIFITTDRRLPKKVEKLKIIPLQDFIKG